MELFDEVTIARLQRRYRHWEPQRRPKLWHVAVSDDYAPLRDWMREQLAALTSGDSRLVSKLHDDKSFVNAFHELCVASLLLGSGHTVAYEPDLEGLTPDLLAHSADAPDRPLLVEAWTRNRPYEAIGRERQWLDLKARLEKIPVAVRLIVVDGPGERPSPADSALSKRVSSSVQEWLLSPLTQRNTVHRVEGYAFAIVGQGTVPYVEFAAPSGAGAIASADQLLEEISIKVDRYREAAVLRNAELMVVASAAEGTALSQDLLRDTLRGHNVVAMSFAAADIGVLGEVKVQMRDNDDPPPLNPNLSAVGWMTADYGHPPGRLTIYSNPVADRPLRSLPSAAIRCGGA